MPALPRGAGGGGAPGAHPRRGSFARAAARPGDARARRRPAAPRRNARRAAWSTLARALAAALLPLPAILFLDFYVVRAAFALLTTILPTPLGAYLVFNYTATFALLLALTYGAIPILVERQVRLRREESHA